MQEKSVLGIDVSKAEIVVKLIHREKEYDGSFENERCGFRSLRNWLKKRGVKELHICMEATGRYGDELAEYLFGVGYEVSVVNPARIKAFGKSLLVRNKTDKIDAQLIAEFCQMHKPDLWTPPEPAVKELQMLVRYLDDLKAMRQQERNRLQSGVSSKAVIKDLKAHLRFLDKRIEAAQRHIQEHINQHPELKRQRDLLASIKGIGVLTAAKILAEVRNIQDFDSPEQLVAYAGLNPKQHQSGSSVRKHTRISKQGNANLRAALYFPAISAKQHNPIVRPFCQRLAERGLCPMSCVAAAMRKLLHLVFGILRTGQPFDPHYLEKRGQMA